MKYSYAPIKVKPTANSKKALKRVMAKEIALLARDRKAFIKSLRRMLYGQ